MSNSFSSDFFAANREKLRQLFTGTAPIVLTAAGLLQRGGDSTYPFEQDASFWYLTGIDDPDITLVLDKDKEYLIVPGREDVRVAFDGAVDATQLRTISGITTVFDEPAGWKQLLGRLKRSKYVATLPPAESYIAAHGFYTNPARARLQTQLKDMNPMIECIDLGPYLAQLRMIKQPVEINALQVAIDITAATIREVSTVARLAKYQYEYEIEADISGGFRRRGASGHAFDPIVASGIRSCTLHNVANNGRLNHRDLIVLDVGAAVNHYAADITRTVSLSKPTKRQQTVYDAVLDVQEFAKTLQRPGTFMRENEQQIENYMGEKLRELGLIKTIDHDEVRRYFPHATSHFLGLNVHDTGDYQRPLEPGVVLTVEPGIYIPEEAIGIRIEDDVLITTEGNRVLSGRLPRRLNSSTI